MSAQLEFWFEYGSTYTYLSVARIGSVAAQAGVHVLWKPFLLMPLLVKAGLPEGPFLPFPAKMQYMWRDLERRARLHGLPYKRPSVYPPNTLQTARVGLLAAAEGWCADFTTAVFNRHWTRDVIIGTPQNLRDSLAEVGRDADEIIARAESAENKAALRNQTEEAQRRGLFGSPSFMVGTELFWGDDRLDDAVACAVGSPN
ncbi:MAG TPA: 2-hydroxychromene-2-carboxylate isomerase [Acetobacteraceae bacterium]|nr:2-hydroxychromene-2-carboxylate isomerase [Acetobacteraceae bacterium]